MGMKRAMLSSVSSVIPSPSSGHGAAIVAGLRRKENAKPRGQTGPLAT